mmetsp:Transcript_5057/g.13597  ORF Transcript_5057/g.13597 Transcript_5057/m.13597 type:complete len:500 (-) Transcript_5057:56-1555(-)
MRKHDRRVIERAKRRARSDLQVAEWSVRGYAWDTAALGEVPTDAALAFEAAEELSVERFRRDYEAASRPVVITNLLDGWPASEAGALTAERLLRHRDLRHLKVRCGEDDDGQAVRIKLKYFLRYMASQRDDSPLYVFDPRPLSAGLLARSYEVPEYFRVDMLDVLPSKRRPPHKWFLIGPKRSGSNVHTDPLHTSAWNALLCGRKRWIFFPPDTPRKLAKAKAYFRDGEDDEPIDYFTLALPRLKRALGERGVPCIEFVQRPGELVYVPGGWWHGVLNLDDTVAITQNFCSEAQFPHVWADTRRARRGMARLWRRLLREHHPAVAAVADEIDARDGFDAAAARAAHHHQFRVHAAARRARRVAAKRAAKTERAARRKAGEALSESESSSSSNDSDSSISSLSDSAGYGYTTEDAEAGPPEPVEQPPVPGDGRACSAPNAGPEVSSEGATLPQSGARASVASGRDPDILVSRASQRQEIHESALRAYLTSQRAAALRDHE